MKKFETTEKQLQEIGGRLNLLTLQGIGNAEHVTAIMAVLAQIAQAEIKPDESNVVEMKKAEPVAG